MTRLSLSGIHGPPSPETDRSESVRDFQNFVGPGPVRSQALKRFSVLVRDQPDQPRDQYGDSDVVDLKMMKICGC